MTDPEIVDGDAPDHLPPPTDPQNPDGVKNDEVLDPESEERP